MQATTRQLRHVFNRNMCTKVAVKAEENSMMSQLITRASQRQREQQELKQKTSTRPSSAMTTGTSYGSYIAFGVTALVSITAIRRFQNQKQEVQSIQAQRDEMKRQTDELVLKSRSISTELMSKTEQFIKGDDNNKINEETLHQWIDQQFQQ